MAKIKSVLTTQEIVTNNIDTYLNDTTRDYPNFLETAPFFVTYYSRSAYQSTFDTSLENYNEIVGEESPNKFHKIDNLPIYSLDTSDFNQEMGDEGWKGEISSSCIILPNTVTPKPDDLIEIEIHSKKYLFQVTNGSSDNYGNNTYYKINFRISQYTSTEADKQITEEFEIDFDLIGKSNNVLIKKDYAKALLQIEAVYNELLESFKYTYFDKAAQSFVLKELQILDQFLNYFIEDNGLNKPFLEFRNSTVISPLVKRYLRLTDYHKTFYSLLSKDTLANVEDLRLHVFLEHSKETQYKFMYFLKNKYKFVFYGKEKVSLQGISAISILQKDSIGLENDTSLNLIFIKAFIDLINNANTENSKNRLDAIIKLIPTITVDYNSFINEVTEDKAIFDYYLLPILLFTLKRLHSLIIEV